ncbi:hypothetical protein Tco_0603565 [Tanacetum coccineum]
MKLGSFLTTKAKLKRYGEELQTKTLKKQRIDDKDVPVIGEKVAEVKEEEQVKRTGKRKKQKARKGKMFSSAAKKDQTSKYGTNRPKDDMTECFGVISGLYRKVPLSKKLPSDVKLKILDGKIE